MKPFTNSDHKAIKLLLKQLNTLAKNHSGEVNNFVFYVNAVDMKLLEEEGCESSETQLTLYGIPVKLKVSGKPTLGPISQDDSTANDSSVIFSAS